MLCACARKTRRRVKERRPVLFFCCCFGRVFHTSRCLALSPTAQHKEKRSLPPKQKKKCTFIEEKKRNKTTLHSLTTLHGSTPQISLAYSPIVRSLEKKPEPATDAIDLRVQPSASL